MGYQDAGSPPAPEPEVGTGEPVNSQTQTIYCGKGRALSPTRYAWSCY